MYDLFHMLPFAEDFMDMLCELSDADVEFVVVGGYAVAFHGYVRATKDIDILINPTRANAERVYRALAAFGAPLQAFDVSEGDFADYDGVLQLGVPPRRIDILNKIDGISFSEAFHDHGLFEVEGRKIPMIGLGALIRNKRASGRLRDLADVEALGLLDASRQRFF